MAPVFDPACVRTAENDSEDEAWQCWSPAKYPLLPHRRTPDVGMEMNYSSTFETFSPQFREKVHFNSWTVNPELPEHKDRTGKWR